MFRMPVPGVARPLAQLIEQPARAQRWQGAGYQGCLRCKRMRFLHVKPRRATICSDRPNSGARSPDPDKSKHCREQPS